MGPYKPYKITVTVLSISFEVDVPTGKVGGSLLFDAKGASFLGGSGGMPPQKILKFRCLEMLFSLFSRQNFWALRTIKIMLYKPYSMFITTVPFLKITVF